MNRVLPESFVEFIYPFAFTEKFADVARRLDDANAGPSQISGKQVVYPHQFQIVQEVASASLVAEKLQTTDSIQFWERDSPPLDEILPHLRNQLQPQKKESATAGIWKVSQSAIGQTISALDWSMVYHLPNMPKGDVKELPFEIQKVRCYLFEAGIGMLSIQTRPLSESVDDWLDFLHYFRYLSGKNSIVQVQERAPLLNRNQFLSDLVDQKNSVNPPLGRQKSDVVGCLMKKICGGWNWHDVFLAKQLIPFSGIFLETDSPEGLGGTPQGDYRLLYAMRNYFHSQQTLIPSAGDLALDHPSLIEYCRRQWFTFSLDGGNFVACDPPETHFFRKYLPHHIEGHYFYLFIITLYQRFVLADLSRCVAEYWLEDSGNRSSSFTKLRNSFLSFTANGYFSQIMQREHPHRCYRKWQEVFELKGRFDEVREEIREMYEWLQYRTTADFQRRATVFGLIAAIGIGFPALITGFFGMNITDMSSTFELTFRMAVWIFGSMLIGGIIVASFIGYFLTRNNG